MAGSRSFDVLVIGSGASGLAAAVSAERAGARVALATKGALQSCNSAKAQGGIQASFGEDDSPEIHAEDIWRSSHETADMGLVEVLTGDAQPAIHWLEELGVEFTRENGGYRIARCDAQAPAPGRRSHRPRDHDRTARGVGGKRRHVVLEEPAGEPRAQ
jgi:succinate dehydrogenase/fumarate reductase flavoprotein subunit